MRTVRLVSVAGLLLAGVVLAWPFRRDWPGAPPVARSLPPVDVPLRGPDIPIALGPPGEASPAALAAADDGPIAHVARRPDLESLGAPPVLPQVFGLTDLQSTQSPPAPIQRNWQPARLKLPTSAPKLRRHRLTDGDSLERLAERYLGNPARAAEIFAANRDLLPAPDLLPLGRIIRIPPRETDDPSYEAQGEG